MALMSDILTRSRVLLRDVDALKHTDAQLLGFANVALMEIYRVRPDLYFATVGTPPAALASGATFPLATYFEEPVVQYTVGRAELRGDEYSKDARAPALMSQLLASL